MDLSGTPLMMSININKLTINKKVNFIYHVLHYPNKGHRRPSNRIAIICPRDISVKVYAVP